MENLVTCNSCSQSSSRTVHVDTARGDQHIADGIDVVHAGPLQLIVQQLPAHTLPPDLGCAHVSADSEEDCVELVHELDALSVLAQ